MTQDPNPGKQSGVDISGGTANVHGDVVGRDKIIQEALRPGVSALHQLPAPPADFTGRATELAVLLEAIQKNGVIISGLQGLGGVGKTALALKLAEKLKDQYPDAQFYIDLKGVTQPLAPKEAMARVIHAYHPTAQLPENEDEVRGLYLSVLHEKRALLLMDNARDDAQVKPLIPPSSCLLLVTSRQHFALQGLVSRQLDQMPHDDACALLRKIAPRLEKANQAEVDKLVVLCWHLPLALEKVGSALLVREDLSPADYIRRLEDAYKRLRLTQTDVVLQSSYDLLASDMQQRFRFLAVFPESFDLRAAAGVWETETDSAQDSLGALLNYSLVNFVKANGRYRLHDLMREFADQCLGEGERLVAQATHAAYYLQVLAVADNLYLKGAESLRRGLALFDEEWSNIYAGHAWAAAHADCGDSPAEACWLYANLGAYCLDLRQHPRERILWLEQALAAAQRMKRHDWEATTLGNLGVAYFSLGEYYRDIELQERVLEIARECGDRKVESQALGNLGLAYEALGEYRRAVQYHERQLKIAREVGHRLGEGNALGNLGLAYLLLGEYSRAIEFQEQRLKIVRDIGDRRGEGQVLGNLGISHLSLGEHQQAIEYIEQQLEIAREIGDREGEGNALWGSALALNWLGNRTDAVARAEASLKIREAMESPHAQKLRDQLAEWKKNIR